MRLIFEALRLNPNIDIIAIQERFNAEVCVFVSYALGNELVLN